MPPIEADRTTSARVVEYRDVPGFIGYRCGDDGSVWSRWRKNRLGDTWKRLKGSIQKATKNVSYRNYFLRRDGRQVTIRGHQIVAIAFFGPCPEGMEVRHLDGDGLNNGLDNLAYGTRPENIADRDLHGTMPRGEAHPDAKVSDADVDRIREMGAAGWTPQALAGLFPLSEWHIRSILEGRWRRMPAHTRA